MGAVLWAALAAFLLRRGGVPWPVALLAAAGAAGFASWRTTTGVAAGFACFAAAAFAAWWPSRAGLPSTLDSALLLLAGFEGLGWITIGIEARCHEPRRVSRRLLGAWFGSTGLIVLGLALSTTAAAAAGGALIAAGLCYRLGTVPVYAWAPLLIRHPDRRIVPLGITCMLLAGWLLWQVLPDLPGPGTAARTVQVLCAVTTPWSIWHAVKQWRKDRHCAASYSVVAVVSGILLAALGRARA